LNADDGSVCDMLARFGRHILANTTDIILFRTKSYAKLSLDAEKFAKSAVLNSVE